jgi:ABC-2 type transport system permease protein
MKSLWTLIKLYLNGIFRFQVMRHSTEPRERRNAITGAVAIVVIAVFYGGMSGWMTVRMLKAGIPATVPFLMAAAMASLFALATAFAQGSATLSGFADFDTLMGMPIRRSTIVLARFLALYLVEAVYIVAYVLPCGVVYAVMRHPVWWFYPLFPVMMLLLPVAPVVIGSGADLLLSAAFARSKYKKGVTSAIKMILLMGFLVFAYLIPQMTDRFMANPMQAVGTTQKIYPPVKWFSDGASGDLSRALLFTLASLAACVLFVFVLNKTFLPLHDRLNAGYHVKNYRLGTLKRSSAFRAMFTIERKRFFNSTAWVINTIIGAVMILVLGIAGAVLSGRIADLFLMPGFRGIAPVVLIGALIFCATLTPTTSSAISMEGKEIWISKSIPVPAKTWLNAKLCMNLVLVGPPLLVTCTLFAIFYARFLNLPDLLSIYLVPVAALLFTTVFGLFVNVKLPRLNWKAETEVVKQSAAVFITMLVCFVLVAAAVVPTVLTGKVWIMSAVGGALLCGAAAVYAYLMRRAEEIRTNL